MNKLTTFIYLVRNSEALKIKIKKKGKQKTKPHTFSLMIKLILTRVLNFKLHDIIFFPSFVEFGSYN